MDSQIQETQSVANTFKTSSCSCWIHKRFHLTPKSLPQAKTHGPLVNMMQINLCFLITKSNLVQKYRFFYRYSLFRNIYIKYLTV